MEPTEKPFQDPEMSSSILPLVLLLVHYRVTRYVHLDIPKSLPLCTGLLACACQVSLLVASCRILSHHAFLCCLVFSLPSCTGIHFGRGTGPRAFATDSSARSLAPFLAYGRTIAQACVGDLLRGLAPRACSLEICSENLSRRTCAEKLAF